MSAYPYRYRRKGRSGPAVAVAVFAALLAASGAKEAGHTGAAAPVAAGSAAAEAIAYARGQLGKPYLWGGTGPYSFDCSGLVMEAYSHVAGPVGDRAARVQPATGRLGVLPRR
jgi:peptidoglycan DL-endopeptidase CwlO